MFAGFDSAAFPDKLRPAFMRAILANTNLRWVGFYLTHVAQQQGDTEWTATYPHQPPALTWRYLRSEGWGLAPLYFVRQFVTAPITLPDGRPGSRYDPNPEWTVANGTSDGEHAAPAAGQPAPAPLARPVAAPPAQVPGQLPKTGDLPLPAVPGLLGFGLLAAGAMLRRLRR